MDVLKETEKKMTGVLEHLKQELRSLRTGRANPASVEHVLVDVYGSKMRLSDIATVSAPEPRQLLIMPFDANNVHAILKGIEAANLNLQPSVDGNVVRVRVPEMNEAARKEIAKQVHKKNEDAKVSIRNARRDSNELVKKQKASREISEDEMKSWEKKIQDLTDKNCKLADEMASAKEKEILTV